MTQAGTYSAVTHYLKAAAAAGTDDPARVLAQMRAMPVEDAFIHAGQVRADGRVMQDALLVRVKKPEDAREPWDYYDVLSRRPGAEVFRPAARERVRGNKGLTAWGDALGQSGRQRRAPACGAVIAASSKHSTRSAAGRARP